MADRTAKITRNTSETQIKVAINIDGTGKTSFNTGVPFLEHMLDQISRHGLVDLDIHANGDTQIDDHHIVEDIGIALGMAFNEAMGNKNGIVRYGHAYVPLDEALARVVLDFSGRPGLEMQVEFKRDRVGNFDIDLIKEFFQAFSNQANITLHIDMIRGDNDHHKIECIFKAFGRALRMAMSNDSKMGDIIPSTKGTL